MKKIILALVVSLVVVMVCGQTVTAGDIPKQGTFSATEYHSGTYKIIMAGPKFTEGHVHMTFESMGVLVNDAGKGFLHKSSNHTIGSLHAVNGIKDEETWFIVYTDLDGDKAYLRTTVGGKLLESAEGTFTFVGGTGKYTGLTGSGELSWSPVTPAAEGTYQGILKLKGHYKLP